MLKVSLNSLFNEEDSKMGTGSKEKSNRDTSIDQEDYNECANGSKMGVFHSRGGESIELLLGETKFTFLPTEIILHCSQLSTTYRVAK